VHRAIVEHIGAGNFREVACAAAGITTETLRQWLQLGAEGKAPYVRLAADMAKAEAVAEVEDLATITKAAKRNWTATAWKLERRHPKRWGDKVQVDFQAECEQLLRVCEEVLPPDQFKRVLMAWDNRGLPPSEDEPGPPPEER